MHLLFRRALKRWAVARWAAAAGASLRRPHTFSLFSHTSLSSSHCYLVCLLFVLGAPTCWSAQVCQPTFCLTLACCSRAAIF